MHESPDPREIIALAARLRGAGLVLNLHTNLRLRANTRGRAAGTALTALNKGIVSEEKPKPVLDEQTLARLLEAAFVLQEHNREVREIELGLELKRDEVEEKQKAETPPILEPARKKAPQPNGDYTFTLAQIVATQHQIQIRNLDLQKTMALVTERVTEIARADGAAIGIVGGTRVQYRAVAGTRTLTLGTEVPTEKALCLPVIRNGQVFRCTDVNPEFLVDTEECRRRGIQSLIAVPIFHDGTVAAGLEVYYPTQSGFTDQDVHSCQLMAGLITEALARDDEVTWKKSLANERAMMLEALEKLKPNLAALMEPSSLKDAPARSGPAASEAAAFPCKNCGHNVMSGEVFCGQCGTPRPGTVRPLATSPSPVPPADAGAYRRSASVNSMEERGPRITDADPLTRESLPESLEEEFPDLFGLAQPVAPEAKPTESSAPIPLGSAVPATQVDQSSELSLHLQQELETSAVDPAFDDDAEVAPAIPEAIEDGHAEEDRAGEEQAEDGLAPAASAGNWTSAASAREFLEQVAAGQKRGTLARLWDTHRGDIYLAVAVILVACVIRWGIWSSHSVTATSAPNPNAPAAATPHKAAPDANLSLFDRMMISFGLAEAPEVPQDRGNPLAQVWVDLHTALYYCPGADAYGKTKKGKFMTQRDAQLDSYEPAFRKTCN